MGVVVSVTNQKGGVGKTATVSSLASALNSLGYKILSIDLDPQRNLDMVAGRGMAIPIGNTSIKSVLDVLKGECTFEDMIVHSDIGDLARASNLLSQWTGRPLISRAEFETLSQEACYATMEKRYNSGWGENDYKVLNHEISSIRDKYDFILMDTNPSLTLLTINSLFAADYVLIPAFAEAASRDAIRELWDTIRGMKAFNPDMRLQVAGILVTKFNKRNPSARRYIDVFEKQAMIMNSVVFHQKIRQGVSVTEYLTKQMDLLAYDPSGISSVDYKQFTLEFLERIKTMEEARSHGQQEKAK